MEIIGQSVKSQLAVAPFVSELIDLKPFFRYDAHHSSIHFPFIFNDFRGRQGTRRRCFMPGVLLVGNGAREHAIAEAIMRSGQKPRLFACMKTNNPGIASLAEKSLVGPYEDLAAIMAFAKENGCEFAVIGPEDPLNLGIVDALGAAGIPAVGPRKKLARL